MSQCICIQGGRIVDPVSKRDSVGDLWIEAGKIVDTPSDKDGAEIIDAKGLLVTPGLVDIHVHFREPGQTHKETIKTGTEAAAAGGFTSVVCMPNTTPAADNAGTIQYIKDAISRDAIVNVFPTGTLTVGRLGERMAPIGSLKKAGAVAITDDGDCVQNNELMRRTLEYAKMFDLVVMDHCQDMSMTEGSVMHEGDVSLKLGVRGWPSAAEDIIVNRNVILAAYTGAHVHMQHITSGYSVDTIRRAKARGIPVTAEVSPHHLAFTDEMLASFDTHFKMNPPLRSEEDRQALIEGVLDGTIDIIATDHAPHANYEKDAELDHAPFGVLGLETALSVTLDVLHHSGKMDLVSVLGLMTYKASDILDLGKGTLAAGADGDVAIVDLDAKWTVDAKKLKSRSENTPWDGQELTGKVVKTIVGGKVVYEAGA